MTEGSIPTDQEAARKALIEQIVTEVKKDQTDRPVNILLLDPHCITDIHGTPLSNLAFVDVEVDKKRFPTVEHAYQADKVDPEKLAALELDPEQYAHVIDVIRATLAKKGESSDADTIIGILQDKKVSAKRAKAIGFQFGEGRLNLIRPDWFDVNFSKMIDLLIQKFQNPYFAEELLKTGDANIIEGSEDDKFFGAVKNEQGVFEGENVLGRMLMNIRTKLRDGQITINRQ